MKEAFVDLWEMHKAGETIAITTNGTVRKDGCAVMGRGCAKEAAEKFPILPQFLGNHLRQRGNHVIWFPEFHLYTFPVKHNWFELANLGLIAQSFAELAQAIRGNIHVGHEHPVFLPRPGCGNGKLRWDDVKSYIGPLVPNNVVIVARPNEAPKQTKSRHD